MIEKLIEHMHWANSVVIDWIKSERKRSEDYLRLTSHILNAERVWICRAKLAEGDRDTFKVHSLGDLSALNDANHRELKSLLQTDVKEVVSYKLFDGTPGTSSIEDMLIHAFSHGFHHVGQMSALASASGEKFPNVSYVAFTRRKYV